MDAHSLDPRELLEHQRRLRRLALSILGDPTRADDVVQDTWLTALHARTPRGDRGSWLAGILRHRARKLQRAESRRAEHESRSARPVGFHDDVDATVDHHRELLEAVDRLDEPYRTVVVLRYLREQSPPAIAERLGLPLETVRTRLRRGLERLREGLDREHPSWALAFLPAVAPPGAATAGTLALTLGGWMTAKLLIAGAALALVAVLAWNTLGRAVDAPRITSPALASTPDVAAPEATRVPGAQASVPATERVAIAGAQAPREPTPAPPILRIVIADWRDDDAGSVALRIEQADQGLGGLPEPVLATVERSPIQGEIRLSLPALLGDADTWPATVELLADHPQFLPARVWVELEREVATIDVPLPMERATFVVGGVARGPGGAVLQGAHAALFALEPGSESRPVNPPGEQVELGPAGAFRLRSRGSGAHVLVVYESNPMLMFRTGAEPVAALAPLTMRLHANASGELDLGTLELDEGLAIRGTVPASSGHGGEITAQAVDADDGGPFVANMRWRDDAFVRVWSDTQVAQDGSFELTGLGPIEYQLLASLRGRAQGGSGRTLSLGRSASQDVGTPMLVRAPADGVVVPENVERRELEVLSGGRPLVGASIEMDCARGSTSISLPREHRITLEFPVGASVELLVQHPEHEPRTLDLGVEPLPPDGVLRVELEPAQPRASVRFAIMGQHAAALESAPIVVGCRPLQDGELSAPRRALDIGPRRSKDAIEWYPGTKPPSVRLSREPDGVRVDGLPAGRYAIVIAVSAEADQRRAPLVQEYELELAPGAEAREEWLVELGLLPRVSIVGQPSSPISAIRLMNAHGVIEGLLWSSVDREQGFHATGRQPLPTGRSVAQGALAPGSYRLELLRRSVVVHTHPFELTLDGSTEVAIDVSDL